MEQKIEPLTEAEHEWIAEQHKGARLFVEAFAPEDAGNPLTLAALDRAFAAWLGTGETDPDQVNSAINCVGAVFGQHLVDALPLEWVIATDEHGSDLAVFGLPGQGDVLVYPANFVAKRWERRETHFLESGFRSIAEQVGWVEKTNADAGTRKPWWKRW